MPGSKEGGLFSVDEGLPNMAHVSGMLTNCPVTGETLSALTPAGKGEEKSSRKALCETARRPAYISK